jgi:hypothetical protein
MRNRVVLAAAMVAASLFDSAALAGSNRSFRDRVDQLRGDAAECASEYGLYACRRRVQALRDCLLTKMNSDEAGSYIYENFRYFRRVPR